MPQKRSFVVVGYQRGEIGGSSVTTSGRGIEASHYEMVADDATGFHIGHYLCRDNFDNTVVGLTKNMVGFTADQVIYMMLTCATNIIYLLDCNLLRNEIS